MNIHFTERAQDDLAEIIAYIAKDNEEAAFRVRDAVLDTLDKLLENPLMVEVVESSVEGLRRAVVTEFPTYIIFYQPVSEGIKIFRIGTNAQDWSNL